jgi:hypothetical protein
MLKRFIQQAVITAGPLDQPVDTLRQRHHAVRCRSATDGASLLVIAGDTSRMRLIRTIDAIGCCQILGSSSFFSGHRHQFKHK